MTGISSNSIIESKPLGIKWKIIFLVLAIANILTIVLPLLWLLSLVQWANAGASGTEYGALLLFPLILVGFIIAVLNVILTLYYLYTRKPGHIARLFSIIFVLLSLVYLYVPLILIIKGNNL